MSSFALLLNVQIQFLIYFIIGIVIIKKGVVKPSAVADFSGLIIKVTLPLTLFLSFASSNIAEQRLTDIIVIICGSVGSTIIGYGLGLIFYRNYPPAQRKVLRFSVLVANTAFIGISLMTALYGETGAMFASIYVIFNATTIFTVGIYIFNSDHTDKRTVIRNIVVNPPLIACILGLLCSFYRVVLPDAIGAVARGLAACNTPLCMIMIGMVLAEIKLREAFNRIVIGVVLIRNLLIPLICLVLTLPINVHPVARAVAVLSPGMPIVTASAAFARSYAGDEVLASKIIMLTTISTVVTLPLLAFLLEL